LCKSGTDDIQDEFKTFGDREMKKRSAMVLLNDVFFRFPTIDSRRTYACHRFKRTCYCFLKLRPKVYFCSENNENNPGRPYYACRNLKKSTPNCSFFVWEDEFDHEIDKQCKCGNHARKLEYPRDTGKYFLVCLDNHLSGCNFFEEV